MLDKTFCIAREVFREFDLSLQNILIDSHRIIIRERIYAYEHFVNEDAKAPPVHRLTMTFLKKDFRCQVFRSTAEGVSLAIYELCKAEVG